MGLSFTGRIARGCGVLSWFPFFAGRHWPCRSRGQRGPGRVQQIVYDLNIATAKQANRWPPTTTLPGLNGDAVACTALACRRSLGVDASVCSVVQELIADGAEHHNELGHLKNRVSSDSHISSAQTNWAVIRASNQSSNQGEVVQLLESLRQFFSLIKCHVE